MSCAVQRGSVEVEGVTGATHGGKQPQNSHRGNSVPTLGGRGHWTTLLLLLYTADGWVGGWGQGGPFEADVGVFGGTPASHRLGGRMKEDTTYAFNLPSLYHRAVSCHSYSAHLCC